MAEQLTEQVQQLGRTIDDALLGVAHGKHATTPESDIKRLTDSFKLLNSRLILLKARETCGGLTEDEIANIPSHEEVGETLNNAITKAKLQQLACDTAQESATLLEYIDPDSNFPERSQQAHLKTELSLKYEEHCQLAARLRVLIKKRNEKRTMVALKIDETRLELLQFKELLVEQEHELAQKEKARSNEQVAKKEKLIMKINRLNVCRLLIVNLLCTSDINFLKYPQWADVLSKCRRPINMENVGSYTM